MAFRPLGTINQLQIEIPDAGTKNWNNEFRDRFFIKVVEHDHSGGGKGAPLGVSSIADNAIGSLKILLSNNQFLRGRNAAANADVNILRVNPSDQLEINPPVIFNSTVVLPANTVTTANVINDAITGAKIRLNNGEWLKGRNAANSANIDIMRVSATNAVEFGSSITVSDDSITTDKIAFQAVTNNKMAANAVTENIILDSSITSNKIVSGAITTDKIVDNAITQAKLSAQVFAMSSPIEIGPITGNYTLSKSTYGVRSFYVIFVEAVQTITLESNTMAYITNISGTARTITIIGVAGSTVTLTSLANNTSRLVTNTTSELLAFPAQTLTVGV